MCLGVFCLGFLVLDSLGFLDLGFLVREACVGVMLGGAGFILSGVQ